MDENLIGQTVAWVVRVSDQHPDLIYQSGSKKTEWEGDRVSIPVVQCLIFHPFVVCQDINIKLRIKTP